MGIALERGFAMYRSLLKRRADFVSILEALYAAEADAKLWSKGLLAATGNVVEGSATPCLIFMAHGDDYANPQVVFYAGLDEANAPMGPGSFGNGKESVENTGPDLIRLAFYPSRPVLTHEELSQRLPREQADQFRAIRATIGVPDAVGVFAYPRPGLVFVLCALLERVQAAAQPERLALQRVASHLDSAFRLRHRPDLAVAAVLAPDGKFLDIELPGIPADRRDVLASQVTAVERSRLRERRREPQALDDWQALVRGRYSIVPRQDTDGKRFYLLVHNSPQAQAHARFTEREAEVVRLAARGFTGKGIAYSLGISPATVSELLGRAAAKVGLRSRLELVRVAGAMFGPQPDRPAPTALTPAEQDVLALLRRGMSNAEIAQLRDRSHHTVANQVAAILRRTGSPSRRALIATGPRSS